MDTEVNAPPNASEERPEDRALVAECLERRPGSQEALLARQAPEAAAALRAVAARWGLRLAQADLDDLLQETFAVLWRDDMRALRTFRGKCALSTYVRTIAASVLCRWRRREGRAARLPSALAERSPGAEAPPPLLEREEEHDALRRAVDALAPRERRVVLAFYWEGASAAEIGRLLGLTPPHVRVILDRARDALARRLGKKGS